jgi:hypothetical protein
MNGAKAPIDKTDWSPLKGKRVIIWPDHDVPGLDYARKAASAAARAGALSVEILKIPPDKPAKWDAADAVVEGGHPRYSPGADGGQNSAAQTLQLYSIAELQRDNSPIPDDLIAPRVLARRVVVGTPKVGKSDFLISLLAHMAGGAPFLG